MIMMPRIIILGANGQLGRELSSLIPSASVFGHSGLGKKINIENRDELNMVFRLIHPDVVINSAAFTNVDACEIDKNRAYEINAESVRNIVSICRNYKSKLYQISTDYVFDGDTGNYKESAIPNPINYYGFSKSIGDAFALSYENSLIIRTSGVYGHSMNFPTFTYESLLAEKHVNIIRGFYSPIHARSLASAVVELIEQYKDLTGIINIAGERVSRLQFAKKIAEKFGLNTDLISEVKSLSGLKAARPYDSSLDISYAKSILNTDFYSIDNNLKFFEESLIDEKK